ncbi:MAG: hypothetical protein HYZ14_00175 [Bacteroidetes bacterium]|nr:hypothetical protein [Bacteroidota bacterium]
MTEDQELELFTIKSKFFREIPHPKLILKAIGQVEKMVQAVPVIPALPDFSKADLTTLLQAHSDAVYALKSAISKAEKPAGLYLSLNELYQWHVMLITRLSSYLPEGIELPDQDIRQSDAVDSYRILQYIKSAGLSENQIKTYICAEIEAKEPKEFSPLTRVCLQSRKIHSNVRSGEPS